VQFSFLQQAQAGDAQQPGADSPRRREGTCKTHTNQIDVLFPRDGIDCVPTVLLNQSTVHHCDVVLLHSGHKGQQVFVRVSCCRTKQGRFRTGDTCVVTITAWGQAKMYQNYFFCFDFLNDLILAFEPSCKRGSPECSGNVARTDETEKAQSGGGNRHKAAAEASERASIRTFAASPQRSSLCQPGTYPARAYCGCNPPQRAHYRRCRSAG
jgi:hypothetical protein